MKLKFKHQKFQEEAAAAVCDVFSGQPFQTRAYLMDKGVARATDPNLFEEEFFTGYNNERIRLSEEVILKNLQAVQRRNLLEPSKKLEGHYNLTIEMETGVGKTYTYIKTMYELNKRYGWSKFIVVVPSIAIREGVFKAFELTCDHFTEDYGKKIRYFIYNSANLTRIDQFASDSAINAMIINSQAFNAKGKDARRIYMELDSFRSRAPMDVIAATRPILIIDEPQSVEGKTTKEKLKNFNPLMTLRYSATHRRDSIYNMVYRLDAMEAYNKRLVKKIAVKGITFSGTTGTECYLYLERINLSKGAPTATLEYEIKFTQGVKKVSRVVTEGYNLYENSNGLEQYKGYAISRIDGLKNEVELSNGIVLRVGEGRGSENNHAHTRRIQIRETIQSHLERERLLYPKGIKVLTLFFIDEVAKYKQYDASGHALNGEYADIFEEEYREAVNTCNATLENAAYKEYLNKIAADSTHAGYFSIDKKTNRIIDSEIKDKTERTSDDADAYDLIMKDKERLLDLKEPVRFIFSHSALREGWDNPNVFQICTLKQSGSEVRKRQEVGRGLRLCVNNQGERMDATTLGGDVHRINTLTVIASESYDEFVRKLQTEIAEVVSDRPREVTAELFVGKTFRDENGLNEFLIDKETANKIHHTLIKNDYVDTQGILTEKYYNDVDKNVLVLPETLIPYKTDIINLLSTIYNPSAMEPEDARKNNVEIRVNEEKLKMKEFQALWEKINAKSSYAVRLDINELIKNSVEALDKNLRVSKMMLRIETGEMGRIDSREALEKGEAFTKGKSQATVVEAQASTQVKFDLIGKIVEATGLTRKDVVNILRGTNTECFAQFKENPEEFIIKASNLINEQLATVIIEHITYNKLSETYETDIFTEYSLKGRLNTNAIPTEKNLYDYLLYDSEVEKNFATELDKSDAVAIYVKLPRRFFINTPVGEYNPDWAIAFYEGKVKHIYFVAETKGSLSSLDIRKRELQKIECAREHFLKISSGNVKYEMVNSYKELLERVM